MVVSIDDALLARAAADEAATALLQIRSTPVDGAQLRDAGDRGAQDVLARRFAVARPHDVVLSEEAADPGARAHASRVWIVDPLDGTREFAERPRSDWAVHVALWADGDLVAGAVALPAQGMTHATDVPPALPDRPDRPIRIAVSRSRPPEIASAVAAQLSADLVPLGSAGAKCASVWAGETDAYVHSGGQYEWDSAAPVAVARAAGLHASRLDGSPLTYNRPDPRVPDLLICRPELADTLLEAVHASAELSVP